MWEIKSNSIKKILLYSCLIYRSDSNFRKESSNSMERWRRKNKKARSRNEESRRTIDGNRKHHISLILVLFMIKILFNMNWISEININTNWWIIIKIK